MPIRRSLKNVVNNYSISEVKVREATSNDPWGPSSTLMTEIADLTYNVIAFTEIMDMLWKRINDHGKNWRHVYKALVLLEYIIKTGSERVTTQCKGKIYDIQTLKDFQFLEEQKDHGLNVREKAKSLIALLTDDERLKCEREKAIKAKQRFAQNTSGISSTGVVVHGSGSTSMHTISETGASEQSQSQASINAELEAVRPSTQGEEELQLALALVMSKEEHDKEVKQQRGDDLKLAMAIEESTKIEEPTKIEEAAKPSDDLWHSSNANIFPSVVSKSTDPWSTSTLIAPSESHKQHQQSSSIQGNNVDPWATPADGVTEVKLLNTDPWSNTPPAAFTTPAVSSSVQPHSDNVDPWSAAGPSLSLNDPWGTSSGALQTEASPAKHTSNQDEFDLLGSRPRGDSDVSNGATDMSSMNKDCLFDLNSLLNTLPAETSQTTVNDRKSPAHFLGDNASLVNLDHLISTPVQKKEAYSSLNPFSNGASILDNQAGQGAMNPRNPFAAQQNAAKGLPMNAMVSSSTMFTNQPPSNQSNLPAPLLPITGTNQNNPFL